MMRLILFSSAMLPSAAALSEQQHDPVCTITEGYHPRRSIFLLSTDQF
jgi:hypothetical protein